ncbi:hypothetical protein M2451_003652 [Dysgonomonas sp. PFB1-18]|uniref:outer membrane beta-barrel protein n=1 Tax=unclassified Dysgonomonas TaxID=2630389 RepID=UPI0024744D19|nr:MULTISPECIES: outer membrane beta-barrel protein [unclassified Dysgonomonas]MDH6310841.1 hypothetical protein [Dysgonomonas sp. PF1-14]MDH6340721.1 hypothetical protein [Dysgonomonas sp. PF1-16]MDH6382311.1 hypothetical protein [Dysgonomonas sp. PFB1-18]MDH6399661.1 hypothetical protein [Dysgonomonas sp. PF1-23]
MEVEHDKIKDLFSSKLGSFEPEVPAAVWGGLDQLLSSQPVPAADSASSSANSSSTHAASSTAKSSILKTIAVAAGLAAAVATGVLLIPSGEPKVDEVKTIVTEEVKPSPVEEVADTTVVVEPYIAPLAVKAVPKKVQEPQPQPEVDIVSEIVEEVASPVEEEEIKEEPKPVIADEPLLAENTLMLPKSSSKGFFLGVKADANLFSENFSQKGGDILFSRTERSEMLLKELKRENSDYKLQHKQPVSFGITVGKQLNSRLSVETGLVYTRLSSKITSNSVFNLNETQTFDYLGIPLSLNYTFYQLGKAKLYLSVGGMVQKDINGRYKSDMNFSISDISDTQLGHTLYYTEPYYIDQSIKQSNLQFSTHANLGISYPLYKKMYLYGTIGGAYYFNAGNEYRTIYSDKKTQLNLNLGVKFDF